MAGEIDLLTLALVQTALSAAMDQAPQDLVVDLAGMSFCCVRGFCLLADTAPIAHSSGIGYAISGLTHLNRIATMLWTDPDLIRYRSIAAAVTSIRIEQTYRLASAPLPPIAVRQRSAVDASGVLDSDGHQR